VLTLAIPRGRLLDASLQFLAECEIAVPKHPSLSRKAVYESEDGLWRFVFAKSADIPFLVQSGAVDLGMVGLDVVRESGCDLCELLRLPYGHCRLVVVSLPHLANCKTGGDEIIRVTSKYPRLARAHFQKQGHMVSIVTLSGCIELALLLGLTEMAVDIVETGRTLQENGLVELSTVTKVQAVLVCSSHKRDRILPQASALLAAFLRNGAIE